MTVRVRAATDRGLKRTHNEDCVAIWTPEPERQDRGVLLVIADGMGGASGGEIASGLAVECIVQGYRNGEGAVLEDLLGSFEDANRTVHARGSGDPELRGMGTTLTALVVRGDEVHFAHVGDSRAYLVRHGAIRQLTQDHSLVAQLVMSRQLTPQQARVDPRRNVVTRSIGVAGHVEVDAGRLPPLEPRDTLVLCTDGLHGVVDDAEIARASSQDDLDGACRELIDLAKQRGGPDNITLILARLDGTGPGASTGGSHV